MKTVAPLRYGVIFKKAFSDIDVFKGFVRDILNINLEIDTVETEKSFATSVGQVKVEFDLYAEDKKNRVIVDIQHQRYSDHYDRFLHYHCAALIEQIKSSVDYRPPLAVYTIVVLTSGDKHKCDVSIIDFDPKDLQSRPLHEIPHKIIYLCPKYLNENTPLPYREWLQVIDDSLDGTVEETHYHVSEIQKVLAHIEADEVSPEERAGMIEEAHLEELQETAAEKAKRAIAKNMLHKGFDMQAVIDVTGLTEEIIMRPDDE